MTSASRWLVRSGEVVLLRDRRGRRYRVKLVAGQALDTHLGSIAHDSLIGRPEGSYALTSKGHRLLLLRPTLAEAVLEMPRQSQVIYPKDLGPILVRGDVFPGALVVEVGLGTGATAAVLLRAVGPAGQVISYETNPHVVEGARRNIAGLLGTPCNHTVRLQDAYDDGIVDRDVDRLVADVPEPWRLVRGVGDALRPGGIFLAYVPTVIQVHQLGRHLLHDPRFHLVETVEVLERHWRVTDRSIRPADRMIAHTGFITTARRAEPNHSAAYPRDNHSEATH